MDQKLSSEKPYLVIINLEKAPKPEDSQYIQKLELSRISYGTAYALAQYANASTSYQSVILAPTNIEIPDKNAHCDLNIIPFDNKILQHWQIWRWHKKIKEMEIVTIGEEGLKLGKWLLKIGKKTAKTLKSIYFSLPINIKTSDLRYQSLCICASDYIAEYLKNIAAKTNFSSKFSLIAPTIDVNLYPISPPSQKERFVFAMSQSLEPDSGALQVIRAMAAIWQHPQLPAWEVRMFGEGPLYSEIMAEAEKLGVLPRLSILNNQSPKEIFAHTNAWLAPGLNPLELPSTFWGGLIAGIPVIASKTPLHIQWLPYQDCVMFVDINNPQDLASAMLKMMLNNQYKERDSSETTKFRHWACFEGFAKRVWPFIIEH